MTTSVCILDYGSGNVRSVLNMLKLIVDDVVISNKAADVQRASHIILPGVGAFDAAMRKIREKIDLDLLDDVVHKKKKPFLGICVGMQVLAEFGTEFGTHQGLGWVPGSVTKLNTGQLPLPHVGWNELVSTQEHPLLAGLQTDNDMYFVHSYAFQDTDPECILAETEYGQKFTSIVAQENVYGVQFHPEKSQRTGRIVMQNFLKI